MARFGAWAPAAGLLGLSLSISVAAAIQPADPRLVAAVFPPWWSAEAVMAAAAAAGDVVGPGGVSFVIVVRSDATDLPERIRAAGAVLVVDRAPFGLCLS
jgi:hypothetical protein